MRYKRALGAAAAAFFVLFVSGGAHAGSFTAAQNIGSARIHWDAGVVTPNAGWLPVAATTSAENVVLQQRGTIKLPTASATVDVSARVLNGAAIVAAFTRFATPVGAAIGVAQIGLELYKEFGLDSLTRTESGWQANQSSLWVVNKEDPSAPVDGPMDLASACSQACSLFNSKYPGQCVEWRLTDPSAGSALCTGRAEGFILFNVMYWSSQRPVVTSYQASQSGPVSLSDSDIQAKIAALAPSVLAPIVADILSKHPEFTDVQPQLDNVTVSGPSSIAGQPINSYSPPDSSGNVVKTVTTPIYNLTYNGDTVSYTVQNQTETQVITQQQAQLEQASQTANEDFCRANPSALACLQLGDPQQEKLPTRDVPVTVPSVGFASSAACPSPVVFTFLNRPFSFSYQPLCDRLPAVRAVMVALSAFAAAVIFVGGLKT